jgi:hypothetical protein
MLCYLRVRVKGGGGRGFSKEGDEHGECAW